MDKNVENLISVVIATFNGTRYIKEAIDSVINQTLKNIEIIVVDDGSTDKGLKDVLNFYIKNNLIKYIKKENGGQGSARNEGIKISKGRYVAFLDDDDYWSADKLEKQYKIIESSNSVLCYSDSFLLNPENVLLGKTSKDLCGNFYHGFVLDKIVFKNFITLSSTLVKRDTLMGNLFNESSNIRRIEDYDLWLRLSVLGCFCYIDEPLVYYRMKPPLNNLNKIEEYRRILKMFKSYILKSKIKYKHYYVLGWLFYFMKFLFFKTKNYL